MKRDPSTDPLLQEPPGSFSDDLRALLKLKPGEAITLGELEHAMRGRGFAFFIILMAGPFVLPVPAFGLSTPFGLAIMGLALQLALGREPWLPNWIRRKAIQPAMLLRLVNAALRLARLAERFLRPRLPIFFLPGPRHLNFWSITAAAFLLCLPLPIPGTNFIPTVPILLIAAGIMERDGLFVLLGHLLLLLAVAVFVTLSVMIVVWGRESVPTWF